MKRRPLHTAAAIAITLGLACRVGNAPQGPAALIFAATAVAGTAVYREATGGCWAACNTGWACNPDTGRCEPHQRDRNPRLQRSPRPSTARPSPPAADAGPDAALP